MSLGERLRTWLARRASGTPRVLTFDPPTSSAEHEALVRSIAALAGMELDAVRCAEREHHVVVTITAGTRERRIRHGRRTLEVEHLLRALESLTPDEHEGRFVALTRAGLRAAHAVAFANARQLEALEGRGWTLIGAERRAPESSSLADAPDLTGGDASVVPPALTSHVHIGSVAITASTLVRRADGSVAAGALAAAHVLENAVLPPGTRVFFERSALRVERARLAEPMEVAGVTFHPDTELEIDRAASVVAAVLTGPAELPTTYRDRPRASVSLRLTLRDGFWDFDERSTEPPRST